MLNFLFLLGSFFYLFRLLSNWRGFCFHWGLSWFGRSFPFKLLLCCLLLPNFGFKLLVIILLTFKWINVWFHLILKLLDFGIWLVESILLAFQLILLLSHTIFKGLYTQFNIFVLLRLKFMQFLIFFFQGSKFLLHFLQFLFFLTEGLLGALELLGSFLSWLSFLLNWFFSADIGVSIYIWRSWVDMVAVLYLGLSQWLVIVFLSHVNMVLETFWQLLNHHFFVLHFSLHLLHSHLEVLLVNRVRSPLLNELFCNISHPLALITIGLNLLLILFGLSAFDIFP